MMATPKLSQEVRDVNGSTAAHALGLGTMNNGGHNGGDGGSGSPARDSSSETQVMVENGCHTVHTHTHTRARVHAHTHEHTRMHM